MQFNIKILQIVLKRKNLNGFIITNPFNIQYLTGFKGISPTEREAILIVSRLKATLITARLYQREANTFKSKNLEVKIAQERNEIDNFIKSSLKGIKKVGFEENNLTFFEYKKYKKLAPGTKLIPTKNLIENLRIFKTEDEIAKIEKAQIISQKAFEQILKTIKAGQTEVEIAHTLKSIIQSLGADGLAFEPIIASGPNSGIPHHVTGRRKIVKGDILLFDFGAKFQNYCADCSRTVFFKNPPSQSVNIFNHVLTAQNKALTIIKEGVNYHEPFHAANNHFKENKLDKYFTHGLGHGIGLEVHEAPYLRSKTTNNKQSSINSLRKRSEASNQQLASNMVFSIEPGLYFPWGGIRLEDLIVIINGRAKVIGNTQKETIKL